MTQQRRVQERGFASSQARMLTKETKEGLIGSYRLNEADTGSSAVQVALLTERINQLVEHLKVHPHDHHCRRGLLKLVGQRRRHLTYLSRRDAEGYRHLIASLGLRK